MMESLSLYVAALILHELGHAAAALAMDVKCYRFELNWFGLGLVRDIHFNRFLDGIITISGPLASLLLLLWACVQGYDTFALANLMLFTIGSLHDFYRLYAYPELKAKARVNRYLAEVCRG